MIVAVTGASGHLGRAVADLILDQLDPTEVVLLTRSPDALAAQAERGADVRRADFDEPATLAGAFAGVDRVLLISATEIGHRVAQHQAAIDAAKAAGVAHVIYTSVSDPSPDNPAGVAADHRATEDAVRASGLTWTLLRNNLYAEYQIPAIAQAIAAGALYTNAGEGRTAYVSRADCAAAAAAVLTQDGHEGRTYDITGSDAIGAEQLAALASEFAGAPVAVVQLDDDAAVAGMTAGGLPEDVAHLFASFGTATREGFLDTVTTAVEDLTGTPPRPLRDVLAAAREQLVAA